MSSQTSPLFLLYAVVLAQFVQLIVVLLRGGAGGRRRRICLLVIAVALTGIIAEFLLTWSGYLGEVPWLMGFSHALPYLLGPALYGYFRAADRPFRPVDALHFLPFVLDIVVQLPFLVLGAAAKTEVYEQDIVTEAYFQSWGYIRSVLFKALHLGAYVWWLRRVPATTTGRGLLLAAAGFCALWLLHTGLLAAGLPGYAITYCVLMVAMGALAGWLHWRLARRVVEVRVEVPVEIPIEVAVPVAPEPRPVAERYEKSSLDAAALASAAARLGAIMAEERPYLQPDLRLHDLAGALGVPNHHLSQILNQRLGQKFNDYVNAHRVREARRLLRTGPAGETMLAVAYAAGFNSKNSFNRAFRKFTGMSPSEYRQQGPSG